MTFLPPLIFTPLADSALLIRLGDGQTIAPDIVAEVWALTAALDARQLPGVEDVVPAYATVLIAFDPAQTDPGALARAVRQIASALPPHPPAPDREVEIPVVYGGEFGPDLADVAAHTGLSIDEAIARHAGASYRVACGGFAPGWDYLLGLPPELATPRLPNPRTHIPPGSVGIGGEQTGIYPLDTPGGWHLIGRTPLRLFDPDRADPFLLHPGDGVRFRPIPREEFDLFRSRGEIPRQARNDDLLRDRAPYPDSVIPSGAEESLPARAGHRPGGTIHVVQPGLLTTVQDLGRPGLGRFGVAPGGALDRSALILGNRLLGNDPGEAGLEISLVGPTLVFNDETAIALTGADLGARRNGSPLPLWQPVRVAAGDELSFQPASGIAGGTRAYLCVAGGFAIDPVLGSRSTDLVGHFGGLDGRPLRAHDLIPLHHPGPPAASILRRRLAKAPPTYEQAMTARVVLGPQEDRFTEEGIAAFLGAEYAVSTKANRIGTRLTGPAIAHANGADLVSEGIAHGAIQVPGDGQPIVLLAGRQTVGGYVKIATVAGADLDRFAQLRPGSPVRFAAVTPDEARAATLRYRAALGPEAVVETPASSAGWGPGRLAAAIEGKPSMDNGGAWDPAGVIRIIEAAQAAGVSSFRLEVAEPGIRLAFRRGDDGETNVASQPPETGPPGETVVTAPVLGLFYRRSAPEQPVFAEEGAHVEAGQTLALLEVMKSYHEVRAPHAGTLLAFLVEDGQFVEYGQPIARLALSEDQDASSRSRQ